MSTFIEWLEARQAEDTRVRAVLKRSLAFEPGTYVPAFPWVEPFLQGPERPWRRKAHYLVAGLWAAQWREGQTMPGCTLGRVAAMYQNDRKAGSTERRFITLLDADEDQLPHRLRQMVALLKEYTLDFEDLLSSLLHWQDDTKWVQNAMARDFYRNLHTNGDMSAQTTPSEENL